MDLFMRASSSRHLRVSLHSRSLHSVAAPLSTSRVPTAAKGCVRKVGTFPLPLHVCGSCCLLVCNVSRFSAALFQADYASSKFPPLR